METVTFGVKGMGCGGCVNSVSEALEALAGVSSVTVSLAEASATVSYDPATVTLEQLKSAVVGSGYETE